MTYSTLGFDEENSVVQISQASRREGTYIIGATGTGKSGLISNLIMQDINQDLGVCVLEPHRKDNDLVMRTIERMEWTRLHGDNAKKRERMARRLKEDVILLDLKDDIYVFGLNLFHCENPLDPFEEENTISRVMHVLEKVYQISRGTPQMNQYFINITRTLLHNQHRNVLDIHDLLYDRAFRMGLVSHVPDSYVRKFWLEFFEQRNKLRRDDEISSVRNKLDDFFRPTLSPIFGQKAPTIHLRQFMDEGKILLVRLNAQWGEITSLVGSILVSQILDAAYSRSATTNKQFNVYADEFQRFATQDFATLFTEARKFGIGLTIAHQVFEQLDPTIKATCKQAANIIVFRVSSDNAKEIAGEFDTAPPPGEWIYEKQMRRAGKDKQVQVWDSPEAEAEYQRLGEAIKQQQSLLTTHETKYKRLPTISALSRSTLPRTMTPELWKIAEQLMELFRPAPWNSRTTNYVRQLYTEQPINFKYIKKFKGSATIYRYEYTRFDWERKPHTYIDHSLFGPRGHSESIRQLLPKQHIHPGTPYHFPDDLPCYCEDLEYISDGRWFFAGTWHDYALSKEIRQMYAQFKPFAWYYFDGNAYNDLAVPKQTETPLPQSTTFTIDTFTDINGLLPETKKLLEPWKGPYFRSDDDWLVILNWFYQKAILIQHTTAHIQELVAKKEQLYKEHHRVETEFEWLGWYEPVPILEKEYLEILRIMGENPMIGDNCKYTRRQGPPPYGSDEVERRTANQIKKQPKYHARVRTASGEYSITTEKPDGGISPDDLQRLSADIRQRNHTAGYLRLRKEVAEDIQQQQAHAVPADRETSPPPVQEQPQPSVPLAAAPVKKVASQQAKPLPPLPQARRKNNICAACSTVNSLDALFCKKCGKKL